MRISRKPLSFLLLFLCVQFSFAQSTSEKRTILQQIVRDDRDAKESVDDAGGINNSLDKLLIEKVDLNKDGQSELIVDLLLGCGAVGNCPIFIYQESENSYRLILNAGGQLHKVLKTITNGYNDVRTEAHSSAYDTYIVVYKYESGRYRAKNCSTRHQAIGGRARITPQKCQQQ